MAPLVVVSGNKCGGRNVEIGPVDVTNHVVNASSEKDLNNLKLIVTEAKNNDPLAKISFLRTEGEKLTSLSHEGQEEDFFIEIARDIREVTLRVG